MSFIKYARKFYWAGKLSTGQFEAVKANETKIFLKNISWTEIKYTSISLLLFPTEANWSVHDALKIKLRKKYAI